MTQHYSRISFLFFLLLSFAANASHFMGVDITYQCLPNGCTYRVFHSTYLDCDGAATQGYVKPVNPNNPFPAPGGVNLVGLPAGCVLNAIQGPWTLVTYAEVTPVCPTTTTKCVSAAGQVNGVVGATYYRDIDLCNSTCSTVQITWTTCCRNYAITSGASGNSIGTFVTTINLGFNPCNSSPQFSVPPVPYLCQGQAFTFSQGAYDPNGDSLSYSVGPCYQTSAVNQVTYAGGFSPTQPLGPGWNVAINPTTGDVTITPLPPTNGPILTAVLCVYVTEWRYINGVATQIGQVARDIQVTVIPCPGTNLPPVALQSPPAVQNGVSNLTGGVLQASPNSTIISSCGGNTIDFDFTIVDLNTTGGFSGDSVTVSWFANGAPMPGATMLGPTGQVPPFTIVGNNQIVCHVNWPNVQPGTYFMVIQMSDNGCPIVGQNAYTIQFNIPCCDVYPIVTTSVANCNTVCFSATPSCGVPPFTYQWTGVNFNFNPAPVGNSFCYTFPGLGNYTYAVTLTDALGNDSTVLLNVNLSNNSNANAGPDVILCPGQTATIGTPGQPSYSYQWSSNPVSTGFLTATNIAQPSVGLNIFTQNPVCVNYFLLATDSIGCQSTDTAQVCFNPNPTASFSIANPAGICEGNCTSVLAPPPSQTGITYSWDFGPANVTSGPNPWGPHTLCYSAQGTYPVSLQLVSAAGCSSNVAVNQVIVHPVPTSTFNVGGAACIGDPITINYTGNASANANYVWNFGGGTILSGSGQGPYVVTWNTAGTHFITLQVDEYGCQSSITTNTATSYPLPQACISVPNYICPNSLNQVVYSCGVGSPNAIYNWTFGPGTVQVSGSGPGPYTLSWTTPGQYQVCLQVTENGCTSEVVCDTVNVVPAPVAAIAQVANQCLGGNSFDFTYTGTPVSYYSWDFGAGASPGTMTGTPTPSGITYSTPGPKTVTVYAVQNGCTSGTASINFTVNPQPVANFTMTHGAACLGECVNIAYSGTIASPQQAFSWTVQNGNVQNSTLQNPGCITFNLPGSQMVTLVVDNLGCKDTASQYIYVHPSPNASAGPDKTFCDGQSAMLNGTPSGGTLPYAYSWWSNPANGGLSSQFVEDPTVTTSGNNTTYYLQVTDAYGCKSNIDSTLVNVLARPLVNAGPDKTLCTGGTVPVVSLNGTLAPNNQAPAPFTYSWFCNLSPNCGMALGQEVLPSPSVSPSVTTIYTLMVTSANGCSSDITTLDTASTVTVFVNPTPIVSAGEDVSVCFGATTQLLGSVSGAGPAYQYQWTPNGPNTGISSSTVLTPTVKPDATTTFTLTASSNGCSASDDVTVTVLTLPTASIEPPVWSICQGESIQLTGAAFGDPTGTTYTYSWVPSLGLDNPNSANPLASPLTTTTYQLFAGTPDCMGFVDNVVITVRPTPITNILDPDTLLCSGDSMKLEMTYTLNGTGPIVGPVIYQWTPAVGVSSPSTPVTWVTPTTTTIYTATISVAGDCPTTDQVVLTVVPPLNAVATADTTQLCANSTTMLYGSGGFGGSTYTWVPSNGGNPIYGQNVSVSPSDTTTYTLTIAEGFCLSQDNITINVLPQPVAAANHSNLSGCAPLTVYFEENAADELSYVWNFGDNSPTSNQPAVSHIYNAPGSYTATFAAVGANGCQAVVNVGPIQVGGNAVADYSSNPPKDSALMVPYATVEFADKSVEATSWNWDFGDGTYSTAQNPRHTYTLPGTYVVTLTVADATGCISKYSVTYTVLEPNLFVPNTFTPNGDGVFDEWIVNYEGLDSYQVQVYDRWGRFLFESNSPTTTWKGTDKQGKEVADGTYYYTLKIGTKVYNGFITLVR